MPTLPKLKVKWWSLDGMEWETTCDFEQAKDIIFSAEGSSKWSLATAEGQVINSYEELVQLANQDEHKDKDKLNVTLIVAMIGGG